MSATNTPSVVKCVLALALTDVSLRLLGFRRTLWISNKLARANGLTSDRDVVGQTISRVIVATAMYPGRSQCLEQSIVNYTLLRRRGFKVKLRFGVQPYPFRAHAWVEENGRAITESPEITDGFAVFADVPV